MAGGPPTAFPPLHMLYEPRCVTLAAKLRGGTPEAVATTTTRDVLSTLLRKAIDRAMARYVRAMLVAMVGGQPGDLGPPASEKRALAVVLVRALYRVTNLLVEDHYVGLDYDADDYASWEDIEGRGKTESASVDAWLRDNGVTYPGSQKAPRCVAAWVVAQAQCEECRPALEVRDTPLPVGWIPPSQALFPAQGVAVGEWLERGQPRRDLVSGEGKVGIFPSHSARAHMSLELLAHVLAVVVHDAAARLWKDVSEMEDWDGSADPGDAARAVHGTLHVGVASAARPLALGASALLAPLSDYDQAFAGDLDAWILDE